MDELSDARLFKIEREIAWPCEQALEVDGWCVAWFISISDHMLIEKQTQNPIDESERDEELVRVRKYLTSVLGMTEERAEAAIELYEEKVDGDFPYISGIQVTIDGKVLIEKHKRCGGQYDT